MWRKIDAVVVSWLDLMGPLCGFVDASQEVRITILPSASYGTGRGALPTGGIAVELVQDVRAPLLLHVEHRVPLVVHGIIR